MAAQVGGKAGSWVDRLVDHLTTPRAATAPPPPPKPPGMPPEAYDDMKVNELRVRQVANIVANENHDVMPGKSSPKDLQDAKVAQAHAIINADRMYGTQRDSMVGTAPREVTAQLENSAQYNQALDAARAAFQEQLAGIDPTDGRMWFNNRPTPSTGLRNLDPKNPIGTKVGVFKVFGPFEIGRKPVYTGINENPNPLPRARVQK